MAKYMPPEGYLPDELTGLYKNEVDAFDQNGKAVKVITTFDAETGRYEQKVEEVKPVEIVAEEPVEEEPVEEQELIEEPESIEVPEEIAEPEVLKTPPPPPPIVKPDALKTIMPPPVPPIPAPPVQQAPVQPAPQAPVQPQPAAMPQTPVQPVQQRPVMPQQTTSAYYRQQPVKPKKKGNGGMIAFLIIAAILILGLGIFAVYKFFLKDSDVTDAFKNVTSIEDRSSSASSVSADAGKSSSSGEVLLDEYGIPEGLIEIYVSSKNEADFVFHGDKAYGTDIRWVSFYTGNYLITAFDSDNDIAKQLTCEIYKWRDDDYWFMCYGDYYIDGDDFVICANPVLDPELDFLKLSTDGHFSYGYYDGTEFSADCNMNKYSKTGSYSFSPGIKSNEKKAADLFGGRDYATDSYVEEEYGYDYDGYDDYYEDYYEGPKLYNVTVPASHYCGIFMCDDFDTFDRSSAPTIAIYENGVFELNANFLEGFNSYCGEYSVEQKGSDIYINLFNYGTANGVPSTATILFSSDNPNYLWFLDQGFGCMGYSFGNGPFGFYRDTRE